MALGLAILALYVILGLAASWVNSTHALQRSAQQHVTAKCQESIDCDEKALRLQARELVTTEATLKVAVYQSIFNFIGVLGLGVTFFYAHQAWREARRSADAALRAFEADHRTWVTVRPVDVVSVIWEGETPRLQVILEIENVGLKPAFGIQVSFEAYIGKGYGAGQPEINTVVDMSLRIAKNFPGGETLISGEKLRHSFSTHVQPLPMIDHRHGMDNVLDANILMTINGVCCIVYRSPSLETLHTSACIAWVLRQDKLDFRPEHGDAIADNLRVHSFNTRMT